MKKVSLFVTIYLTIIMTVTAQNESRLLRFPAIHGNQIAFSYAGDLYLVHADGGVARKLTSGNGYDMFAHFSPDGKHIAFTGQYDGNTEVFLISANGGVPKRLTYTATLSRDFVSDRMGPNNIVMAWTPDSKHIIYRSRKKTFNDFVGHLYKISIDGGMSEELPLSTGGFCSYSPDGKKLAFNRVFREFRTWKYYHGGMADDIRIFDFDTKKIENISDNIAQDVFPMWIGNDIYYVSDRDRIANLFAYNTVSKETRKVTNFDEYDIKFPSHSKDAIVFENGGFIYVFDVKTQKSRKVSIQIANDINHGRDTEKDAAKNIQSVDISPDGERLVLSARGDVFTVPAESGITRNITKTSGIHERNAVWSPDGKYIAYISDKIGEFEIYIQAQDGTKEAVQLTKDADTYYFGISWSPDSKHIMWNDKKMRLRYVNVDTKAVVEIAQSNIWEYSQYVWSPDSKWISYVESEENGLSSIKLYSVEKKKVYEVTDSWYRSYSPSFSRDGKYLFFVSDRDFNPIYSRTEWNHAYNKMAKVYFVTLDENADNPIYPKNNEVEINKPVAEDNKTKDKDKKEETKPMIVTPENMNSRILSLPVQVSHYYNITSLDDKVYYMKHDNDIPKTVLCVYDFKQRKETEIMQCSNYSITANSKKMLISNQGKYYVIDLPAAETNLDKNVSFDNMKVWSNLREEWSQIFYESWRQMRDFFYVENMHGLDWEAMKKKYEVLLPYVNHRHDLNYVIGELIGELNVGHAYVGGGDVKHPERINMGLLGATFSKDKSGYFKVESLLEGANWSSNLRSPLTEQNVGVEVGHYIVAIDGVDLKSHPCLFEFLKGKAEKQVEITVSEKANGKDARNVIVVPIKDESNLYYYNWVQNNIRKVSEATNGEVGYIHIPDMGVEGLNEFVKHFYPQIHKKALIIDDRGNGGGNVSPMIIERLQRQAQRANMARNVTIASQTPKQMVHGPIVVLINQYSASDGDLFPYGVKHYGIGKVIGVRSWGGVVGIRGTLPFIDGAVLNRPEFASYDHVTGEWIIEGWGVDPDIEIDNDPYEEYLGKDTQLDKAIEVIKEEMKNFKPLHQVPEKGPDKSK